MELTQHHYDEIMGKMIDFSLCLFRATTEQWHRNNTHDMLMAECAVYHSTPYFYHFENNEETSDIILKAIYSNYVKKVDAWHIEDTPQSFDRTNLKRVSFFLHILNRLGAYDEFMKLVGKDFNMLVCLPDVPNLIDAIYALDKIPHNRLKYWAKISKHFKKELSNPNWKCKKSKGVSKVDQDGTVTIERTQEGPFIDVSLTRERFTGNN